ncbi:MAG: hypothetical protein WCH04_21595 [Gammaproteobacteria bacterium]
MRSPHVIEQEHVPAELGLQRLFGIAALVQPDEGVGERLNHLCGGEPVGVVAAFRCRGIG